MLKRGERELCKLYSENEKLVPFVYHTYFKSMTIHKEDLLQEGYMELWRVANKFVDDGTAKFSSYAISCIKGKMAWYLNKNTSAIKPPEELIRLVGRVKKKYGVLADAPNDIKQIAKEFKCSEVIAMGLQMVQEGNISLDSEVKSDGEATTSIGDLYAVANTNVEKEVEDKMILEQFVNSIDTARDRYIFLRVLDGESYTNIAKKINITSQHVGRVAKRLCKEYLELKGVMVH